MWPPDFTGKRKEETLFQTQVAASRLGIGRHAAISTGHAPAAGGQAALAGQLASLLAGMGQELLAVLPEQASGAREQLAAQLDEGRLRDVLQAHQVGGRCSTLITANYYVKWLILACDCLPECVGQKLTSCFCFMGVSVGVGGWLC